MAAVERGDVKALQAAGRGRVAQLRAALSRTRDPIARQQAFNTYVQSGGASALAEIGRHTTGRKTKDLELKGSAVFDGAAGRQGREAKLAAFEARLQTLLRTEGRGADQEAARAALTTEVKAFRAGEKARLRQIIGSGASREVPPAFRQELEQRARATIRACGQLLAQAAPKGDKDAGLSPEQRALREQLELLDRRADALEKAARLCEWHRDGHNGRGATRAAQSMLQSGWSANESSTYESIDRHRMWARVYSSAAGAQERLARDAAAAGKTTEAIALAKQASTCFGDAIGKYQSAVSLYSAIQRRWQGEYPGYFKGLHSPPG